MLVLSNTTVQVPCLYVNNCTIPEIQLFFYLRNSASINMGECLHQNTAKISLPDIGDHGDLERY